MTINNIKAYIRFIKALIFYFQGFFFPYQMSYAAPVPIQKVTFDEKAYREFLERNSRMLQRREKLRRQRGISSREAQELNDLKECTFAPRLNKK